MTRPKIRIDATGLASADRQWREPTPANQKWTPDAGEMRVRVRLGRLFAFYEAGARSERSDPLFRKGCAHVLAELAPHRTAWETVTGRCWNHFYVKREPGGGPETGPMRQSIGGTASAGMPNFSDVWDLPEIARAERGREQVLEAAKTAQRERYQRMRAAAAAENGRRWEGWSEAARESHARADRGRSR